MSKTNIIIEIRAYKKADILKKLKDFYSINLVSFVPQNRGKPLSLKIELGGVKKNYVENITPRYIIPVSCNNSNPASENSSSGSQSQQANSSSNANKTNSSGRGFNQNPKGSGNGFAPGNNGSPSFPSHTGGNELLLIIICLILIKASFHLLLFLFNSIVKIIEAIVKEIEDVIVTFQKILFFLRRIIRFFVRKNIPKDIKEKDKKIQDKNK